jgi:hypothetical protein
MSTMKLILLVVILFSMKVNGVTQDTMAVQHFKTHTGSEKKLNNRKWILGAVQTSLWAGALISLEKAWYSDYEKSSFQTFNDWNEWQQMDKIGHFYSAYHINEQTTKLWEWAGTERKKSILIGGISSLVFLNTIELLDAYSAKWGFSGSDVVANFMGTGFYIGQALAWKEQRIRLKFSYHPKSYRELNDRANQLFGNGAIERALKDYNGQTYWASINLKSFFPSSKLPNWLCLSIGYGADNMLGGFKNEWTSLSGTVINRSDLQRSRKYLLSADLDLSKLKPKSKVVKTIFSLLNTIKIPAPTIVFNTKSKASIRFLYF